MVTINDALRIIKKEMPTMNVYSCSENKTFFFFTLQPKRLAGTDQIPCGGSAYVIWKDSGKFDMINFDLWEDNRFQELILDDKTIEIFIRKGE